MSYVEVRGIKYSASSIQFRSPARHQFGSASITVIDETNTLRKNLSSLTGFTKLFHEGNHFATALVYEARPSLKSAEIELSGDDPTKYLDTTVNTLELYVGKPVHTIVQDLVSKYAPSVNQPGRIATYTETPKRVIIEKDTRLMDALAVIADKYTSSFFVDKNRDMVFRKHQLTASPRVTLEEGVHFTDLRYAVDTRGTNTVVIYTAGVSYPGNTDAATESSLTGWEDSGDGITWNSPPKYIKLRENSREPGPWGSNCIAIPPRAAMLRYKPTPGLNIDVTKYPELRFWVGYLDRGYANFTLRLNYDAKNGYEKVFNLEGGEPNEVGVVWEEQRIDLLDEDDTDIFVDPISQPNVVPDGGFEDPLSWTTFGGAVIAGPNVGAERSGSYGLQIRRTTADDEREAGAQKTFSIGTNPSNRHYAFWVWVKPETPYDQWPGDTVTVYATFIYKTAAGDVVTVDTVAQEVNFVEYTPDANGWFQAKMRSYIPSAANSVTFKIFCDKSEFPDNTTQGVNIDDLEMRVGPQTINWITIANMNWLTSQVFAIDQLHFYGRHVFRKTSTGQNITDYGPNELRVERDPAYQTYEEADAYAQSLLSTVVSPSEITALCTNIVSPDFTQLELGDTVRLRAPSYGIAGNDFLIEEITMQPITREYEITLQKRLPRAYEFQETVEETGITIID